MYSIKIPDKIQIGGHYFSVVVDEGLSSDGNRAKVDYRRLVISIHPNRKDSIKSEAIIHEVLHAINTVYLNNQIDSEDIIEPLAEGLWQVFEQLGIEFDFGALPDETKK